MSYYFFCLRGAGLQRFFSLFIVCCILFFVSCGNPKGLLDEGTMLPDFTGFTPTGDTLSLSTFTKENKILLVNFWAAWCSDCLKHNPELVAMNKAFSGKKLSGYDFEMVSISLDQDTGLWKRRMMQQNLTWKNQITDMKGWQSAQLKAFSVHSIPSNYLVDHTGKIIATDVESGDVEKILEKYYGKTSP